MKSNKQPAELKAAFVETHKAYLLLLITIVISSVFFTAIYRFDNIFTQDSAQATNGVLRLTAEEMEKYPSRYLINDWKLYGGALLTPEDFADGEPSLDYTVVSIGRDVSFNDGGNCVPFTCGTYAMRLRLPEEYNTYSIAITQAFSAFKMYIDGKVVLQVGNPDPENFLAATSNRMAAFDVNGSEEILVLIAVNNGPFYRGGLITPPMLGLTAPQNVKRVVTFGIKLAFASITFVSAILCAFFAVKQRKKLFLLIAVMFIIIIGYTSNMVIHTFFVLPFQPWYFIELLCGYIVLTGVVIMHGAVCHLPKKIQIAAAAIVLAALPLICVYGLNMELLSNSPLKYMSSFLSFYKLAVGIYLIITGALSLKKAVPTTYLVFFARVAYGCACIWERLLPEYQPVYFSGFLEWSCGILVVAIDIIFVRQLFVVYADRRVHIEEQHQMTRQLEMQRDYSADIRAHSEENRRLIHDFRQHLRVIEGLAQKRGNTEISDYLKAAKLELDSSPKMSDIDFCENSAVDALFRYYGGALAQRGIAFSCNAIVPNELPLPDTELCSVLGNLLENAMEACDRGSGGKVTLTSSNPDGYLYITIKNSCDKKPQRLKNTFVSEKRGGAGGGIGIVSARQIVEKRGGRMDISTENGVFIVTIELPLTTKQVGV